MINDIFRSNNTQVLIREYGSGEDILLSEDIFNLYILDIKMDKLTGIDVAKQIRKTNRTAGIVFITALKDYVFDAFDVNAFHYLLKPVDKEKLTEVLTSFLSIRADEERFIIAKTLNQAHKIYLKDILYLEAQLRKIKIHTNHSVIEYYCKFSDIAHETEGHGFFRCHKSYIVNLRYVSSYTNSLITLKNNENIYLSKYKYAEFSKLFMYYLKNGEQEFE